MLVLDEDKWRKLLNGSIGGTLRHVIYHEENYNVMPDKNVDNIEVIGSLHPADFKADNSFTNEEEFKTFIKKGLVTVSFFDNTPTMCFVSGTKVLMRNGEYKCVDDLTVGDLLMTVKEITSLNHIAEVKNVVLNDINYDDVVGNHDMYFVEVVTSKNFEFNGIFIKSDAYAYDD